MTFQLRVSPGCSKSAVQVLQEKGVFNVLHHIVATVANEGFVGISSHTGRVALALGEVATDWISRHLGNVRLYPLQYARSHQEFVAALLVWLI